MQPTSELYAAARAAFEAYSSAVGGHAVSGEAIPQWDAVGERVQRGWLAAAAAVRNMLDSSS
jgi:hypothetical protein